MKIKKKLKDTNDLLETIFIFKNIWYKSFQTIQIKVDFTKKNL